MILRGVRPIAIALVTSLSFGTSVFAGDGIDVVLFPSLGLSQNVDGPGDEDLQADPRFDLFAAGEYARLRGLFEYILSEDESEIERAQIGYLFGDVATAWIGRFHTPIGYWNTAYHHGQYLQDTVSRPGIIDFEDEGGVLPTHVTGAYLQANCRFGESALRVEGGVGWGPELAGTELEPVDVTDPGSGSHGLSSSLKVAYAPNDLSDTEFGLYGAYTRIPADRTDVDSAKQGLAGVYAAWSSEKIHVLADVIYQHGRVDGTAGSSTSSFGNVYIQGLYWLSERWNVYARLEATAGDRGDPYLALIPNFVEDRRLGGVGFRVNDRQGLKLEVDNAHAAGDWSTTIFLEWSAAFELPVFR